MTCVLWWKTLHKILKTFGKEKLKLDHENQKNIQRRTRVTLNALSPFNWI
jgi:hypothetical protein